MPKYVIERELPGAGKLTADDLRDIDQAAAHIEVQGARYPEFMQRMIGPR